MKKGMFCALALVIGVLGFGCNSTITVEALNDDYPARQLTMGWCCEQVFGFRVTAGDENMSLYRIVVSLKSSTTEGIGVFRNMELNQGPLQIGSRQCCFNPHLSIEDGYVVFEFEPIDIPAGESRDFTVRADVGEVIGAAGSKLQMAILNDYSIANGIQPSIEAIGESGNVLQGPIEDATGSEHTAVRTRLTVYRNYLPGIPDGGGAAPRIMQDVLQLSFYNSGYYTAEVHEIVFTPIHNCDILSDPDNDIRVYDESGTWLLGFVSDDGTPASHERMRVIFDEPLFIPSWEQMDVRVMADTVGCFTSNLYQMNILGENDIIWCDGEACYNEAKHLPITGGVFYY